MHQVFLYAGMAAIGNAIFVFAQRSAGSTANPFVFMAGAILVCLVLFVAATIIYGGEGRGDYLLANAGPVVLGGVGFFITFVGFFLMYSRVGANSYTVYATLSILTTSVGVGLFIFRENFNAYHIGAIVFAVLAVCCFGYGQYKLNS